MAGKIGTSYHTVRIRLRLCERVVVGELEVLEVLLTADASLPALAAQLGVGTPHAARLAAEAEAAAVALTAAATAVTVASAHTRFVVITI